MIDVKKCVTVILCGTSDSKASARNCIQRSVLWR